MRQTAKESSVRKAVTRSAPSNMTTGQASTAQQFSRSDTVVPQVNPSNPTNSLDKSKPSLTKSP